MSSLLRDLEVGADTARETAVARLSVIGTRAVEGLLTLLASTPTTAARVGALAALESIADPRAASAAFAILEAGEAALLAPAAAVLRRLLESPAGGAVLDRLAAIAIDPSYPDPTRLAAFDALRDLPETVTAPLRRRLADDPRELVRRTMAAVPEAPLRSALDGVERAADGPLPGDPELLRHWLSGDGGEAPLPTLHRLVGRLREREAHGGSTDECIRWTWVRGAVHLALARRGSTVALYDLRETFERREAVSVEMLAALETIGDASCLEAVAAAWADPSWRPRVESARSDETGQPDWWRTHLASACRAILARERLSDRHPVIRRIRTRWPDAALPLLGPPKAARPRRRGATAGDGIEIPDGQNPRG